MSTISRRDFIRLAAAGGAVTMAMGRVAGALAATPGLPPVLWLQGQSCSGCSVSLLNATYPDIAQIITQVVSLKYHMTVMAGTGDVSTKIIDDVVAGQAGKLVLVLEGSIPAGGEAFCSLGQRNGKPIPFDELVLQTAGAAQACLSFGACAAYGGIPAAEGSPTGAKPLAAFLKDHGIDKPVINVPGCPPHPDWMVGTIAHYLWYGVPELDESGRPKLFYPNVHENCERYSYFQEGKFASYYGEPLCLYELGCKGPVAGCDVMKRGWNNGVNNCISCGSPCLGCTEPTFPDHFGTGLRGAVALNGLPAGQTRNA